MRPSLLTRGRRATDLAEGWRQMTIAATGVPSRSRGLGMAKGLEKETSSPPSCPARSRLLPLSRRVVPSGNNGSIQRSGSSSQQRCYSSSSASGTAAAPAEAAAEATGQNPGAARAENTTARSTGGDPIFYYDLFSQSLPQGPPPRGPFKIDVRALRREFLQLQAAAHPDFHHHAASAPAGPSQTSTSAESETAPTPTPNPRTRYSKARLRAEAASALINEAYRTLASPLLRAQYLLHRLHGIDLAGDEAGTSGPPADPELLVAVLECREEIEEAASEADLDGVRKANEARIRRSEEVLADCFGRGDVEGAAAEAVRLRYWVNIRESVDNWEEPGRAVVLQH